MTVDYKYKPNKHKFNNGTKTIDEMHKEFMTTFQKDYASLPEKKMSLEQYENEYNSINNEPSTRPINMDQQKIKQKKCLKNKIIKLQKDINDIENSTKEMKYFGKTGDVIYDYYQLTNGELYNNTYNKNIENQQQNDNQLHQSAPAESTLKEKIEVSDALIELSTSDKIRKTKKPVKRRNKTDQNNNHRTIMNYLVGADSDVENDTQSRATLENEYMIIIDKEYACEKSKLSQTKKCNKCDTDMIVIYSESIICCTNPQCGEAESIFIECDMPSQKDSFTEKPKYPYRRIGHCIEKLNQFQSKGTTNIPPNVFRILGDEIDKHNLQRSDITMTFLEKMLKKHKLSNYYENVMYIYCQITGTPPMTLTRSEIDTVVGMFLKAEELYYTKYKPVDRDNFLKYSFTLHKIFTTIGKHDHAQYFKLLKSPWKMKQQEAIWKNICMDVGWAYTPS